MKIYNITMHGIEFTCEYEGGYADVMNAYAVQEKTPSTPEIKIELSEKAREVLADMWCYEINYACREREADDREFYLDKS